MKKIIQLNSSSILGGGQRVMFDIVDGLEKYFDFIIVAPAGLFLDKYQEKNISTIELKKRNLLIIKEIRKIIDRERPNIIHAHGTRAAIWLRLAIIGLKNKPRIIYTLHGFHLIRRKLFIRWLLLIFERFLNHWIDVLVCVSESDKKLVLKYKTIPKNKIVVIKNGIDIEKFQTTQQEIDDLKNKLRLENNFVLTTIGRLHQQKDFSTILRALKLILFQIKDIKLLIIGEGPLRKFLEREVKNLNLELYVKFLGACQNIPTLIKLSDLIILSTKWEGLPLVPLEVGASKKPIIASDINGVRETIINGETGYLFKSSSEKILAEKILELLKSKDLREKTGEKAFKFVSKNFSKEIMIEQYRKLYLVL